jgi:hypothetical protein
MSWFATITFCNVAGVSEVELVGDRAKGLRLRDLRGTSIRSTGTFLPTKKEERRKIEASHRKPKRNFEPKVRKILFGMSFLEQAPCFATDKHFFAMNPQWHHVLRRPNSQDLRRIKFTKKLVQAKVTTS